METNDHREDHSLTDEQRPLKRIIALFLVVIFVGGMVLTTLPGLYLPSLDFIFESAKLSRDDQVQQLQKSVVQITAVRRPENHTTYTQLRGTGFNIDPAGVIITNHHVIQNAVRIVVTFPDGSIYNVKNWDEKPEWDLAVITLENTSPTLPVIPLGDSDQIRPGGKILVIGNPLGLKSIVIKGTLGRTLGFQDYTAPVVELVAPIHPGNSGSPVIDDTGQVVGVVFGTYRTDNDTRGLALPINYVRDYLDTLRKTP